MSRVVTACGSRHVGSERRKTREAKQWTGRDPKRRQHPYTKNVEEIKFVMELWAQGEMEMVADYAADLKAAGYSADVVASILAQGTQGVAHLMNGTGTEKYTPTAVKVAA